MLPNEVVSIKMPLPGRSQVKLLYSFYPPRERHDILPTLIRDVEQMSSPCRVSSGAPTDRACDNALIRGHSFLPSLVAWADVWRVTRKLSSPCVAYPSWGAADTEGPHKQLDTLLSVGWYDDGNDDDDDKLIKCSSTVWCLDFLPLFTQRATDCSKSRNNRLFKEITPLQGGSLRSIASRGHQLIKTCSLFAKKLMVVNGKR